METARSKSGAAAAAGCRLPSRGVARRSLLLLASVVMLAASSARAQTQPNLIFILTDDQGIDAIEGADWPNDIDCHTPNLSHFASQGTVFSVARVNSKCSPTRSALMTGRVTLTTGVTDRIGGAAGPDLPRLSLQGNEETIAELLRQRGYDTILMDKWHCGFYRPYGQSPDQQGFDVFVPYQDNLYLDDPEQVGDEHMSLMVDTAIDAVNNRPDPNKPFALFYWSYDPHGRNADSTGKFWWKVDQSLLPSGIDYYGPGHDTNRNRYRAVVEALDTELNRLLASIGVVDSDGAYRPASNSVVFFAGDNGTPERVAPRPNWAKGSIFEGGVRVPFFVFGRSVPDGRLLNDLVDSTDFYDTVADVIGAPAESRGALPRQGRSFADLIGWADPLPRREFTMSSIMRSPITDYLYVALADTRYKLIARAGYPGLAPLAGDRFHDLASDQAEVHDLVREGMNANQRAAYLRMREQISNYWPTAVGERTANQVDVPLTHFLCMGSDEVVRDQGAAPLGFIAPNQINELEIRLFLRFNIQAIDDLLPPGRSFSDVEQAQIILTFGRDNPTGAGNGDTGPITAYPMLLNWYEFQRSWEHLARGFEPTPLGTVDLPPFIVVETHDRAMEGIPMPSRTPVSLADNADLLQTISFWRSHPLKNYGITVLAAPLQAAGRDQHLDFLRSAAIRLTLRH